MLRDRARRTANGGTPLRLSVRFLFGRPFGRRESLETLVRNRLPALDRASVGPGGKPALGTLDGGELLAQIVCQTLVELLLIEIGGQVARIFVPGLRERPFDPLALPGQQLTRPLRIHQATLPIPNQEGPATEGRGRC